MIHGYTGQGEVERGSQPRWCREDLENKRSGNKRNGNKRNGADFFNPFVYSGFEFFSHSTVEETHFKSRFFGPSSVLKKGAREDVTGYVIHVPSGIVWCYL